MQVILSKDEYNELENKGEELEKLKQKLHEIIKINYNDDGDFYRHIRPSIKDINIDENEFVKLCKRDFRITL